MCKEEKQEWLHDAVKILILFWSGTMLTLSYWEPPSGKKISGLTDFPSDPDNPV